MSYRIAIMVASLIGMVASMATSFLGTYFMLIGFVSLGISSSFFFYNLFEWLYEREVSKAKSKELFNKYTK